MTARWITADVFDGLATLETESVDVVITSPPFLALRSYLPADHELKGKEIGSEATPAEFIDTMLRVTAELRRVLAPHGSICVELGDTYAGGAVGWTDDDRTTGYGASMEYQQKGNVKNNPGWPLAKSRTLIPSLYQIALAYGFNPLTGTQSPAGQWRIRNVVTWARPNPPVGALGDKWRPATSDLVIACTSSKRYWDDLATRKPQDPNRIGRTDAGISTVPLEALAFNHGVGAGELNPSGAPLLDYWVIPPGGYTGAHYAVFPEELVVPCVKAMCPQRVCKTCGEPSRRIVERPTEWRSRHPEFADFLRDRRAERGLTQRDVDQALGFNGMSSHWERAINHDDSQPAYPKPEQWVRLKSLLGIETDQFDDLIDTDRGWAESLVEYEHVSDHPSGWTQDAKGRVHQRLPARKNRIEPAPEWTDCGHDNWRPGLVLDPFAGSGTTLAVATGHGHDAIGIDIDQRNYELALERIGPFLMELV